jgi:hypothetical protein
MLTMNTGYNRCGVRSSGFGSCVHMVLSLVAWAREPSTRLVHDLGAGVDVRAAAFFFYLLRVDVGLGRLGNKVIG